MNYEALETLSTQVDEIFFVIAAIVFAIELAEMAFKRAFSGRKIMEMVASASTQIPYLLVEVFFLTATYSVYYIISESWISWSIPITWWSVVLILVLADFAYYWEHRIAHEVRLLWTQHAVHHSSRDMNIVTAFRFGPLEGVWSLIIHVPLVLIGFPPDLVFFGVLAVLAYQTWLHTELVGKLGPVEWIMNTPSHHRVHHGADDKYLDKNYAGILIIWDRMFGTFKEEEETPRYGLKRDFNSQNPVVVWFSELPQLGRDLANARSMKEVWMRLFAAPNWKPEEESAKKPLPTPHPQ
ncbi:MAG: sterol desaturase family protein [Pseudomonadota bacterium]